MLVELTSHAGMLYGEQVKLSTPKLRQNKEKNKNSDFSNHNNEDPLHLEGKPSFDRLMRRALCAMAAMFAEINTISASENSIMKMPHLQPQNYGEMKRRIKTLHSKVVTMYSLYFVK